MLCVVHCVSRPACCVLGYLISVVCIAWVLRVVSCVLCVVCCVLYVVCCVLCVVCGVVCCELCVAFCVLCIIDFVSFCARVFCVTAVALCMGLRSALRVQFHDMLFLSVLRVWLLRVLRLVCVMRVSACVHTYVSAFM